MAVLSHVAWLEGGLLPHLSFCHRPKVRSPACLWTGCPALLLWVIMLGGSLMVQNMALWQQQLMSILFPLKKYGLTRHYQCWVSVLGLRKMRWKGIERKKLRQVWSLVLRLYLDIFCFKYTRTMKTSLVPVVTLLSVYSLPYSQLPSYYSSLNCEEVVSVSNVKCLHQKKAFYGTFSPLSLTCRVDDSSYIKMRLKFYPSFAH